MPSRNRGAVLARRATEACWRHVEGAQRSESGCIGRRWVPFSGELYLTRFRRAGLQRPRRALRSCVPPGRGRRERCGCPAHQKLVRRSDVQPTMSGKAPVYMQYHRPYTERLASLGLGGIRVPALRGPLATGPSRLHRDRVSCHIATGHSAPQIGAQGPRSPGAPKVRGCTSLRMARVGARRKARSLWTSSPTVRM